MLSQAFRLRWQKRVVEQRLDRCISAKKARNSQEDDEKHIIIFTTNAHKRRKFPINFGIQNKLLYLGGLFMKIKRLTAVFAAAVMALSMATAASAETPQLDVDVEITSGIECPVHDFEIGTGDNENDGIDLHEARLSLTELKAKYPHGSYYSQNGGPCSCHGWCDWDVSYNYSTGAYCNCINYDSSIQCIAFSKYVFYNLKGYKWANGTTSYKNVSNVTETTAKNALKGTSQGSYVLVKTRNSGVYHSFSYISSNDSYITLYDADWNLNCNVRYRTMSWSEFAEAFKYIEKVVS